MIPFALPALVLIALDLHFGIKASRHRYQRYKRPDDRVTFSKALRGTVGKTFEFAAWLILASSMTIAFKQEWIQWLTLGLVYVNELASIVGNYLETKGLQVNWKYVFNTIFKLGGQKVGVDASDVDSSQFVKPLEKEEK